MDYDYDLLRDAAALIDEFEPFGLDFNDGASALSVSTTLSSPDAGFVRATTAALPVPPAPTPSSPTHSLPVSMASDNRVCDEDPYKSDASNRGFLQSTSPSHPSHQQQQQHHHHHHPQTIPQPKDPSTRSSKTSTAKNPSRERLKAELTFLREKVGEMEKELGELRFQHEQVATANAKTTAIAPVWRRIAERQLERRRCAETENERLKNMLDGQIRVAKSLEQMLRKRSSAAMIDLFEGARGSRKRCRLDDNANLESWFAHFEGEIEDAYRATDEVFETNGLANTFDETVRGYTVKTRNWGGTEQLFVELMDVKIVPFDLERASSAVWRTAMEVYMAQHRPVEKFEGKGDRFAVKYQTKSRSHDYEGLLDVTMVMRKFVDKDNRMVLVWRAINSPAQDNRNAEWRNVYTEETGWMVVKRVPDDHAGLGTRTAVMQSCVHLIPRWYGSESPTTRVPVKINTGDFAKLVMNSYEEDVIAITEAVENMLLDETVGVQRPESHESHEQVAGRSTRYHG